jgi:hypothetical protein
MQKSKKDPAYNPDQSKNIIFELHGLIGIKAEVGSIFNMQIQASVKKDLLLDKDDKDIKINFECAVDHIDNGELELDIEKDLNTNLQNIYD